MSAPTLSGLCAGAGGLEEAARRVFGARPLWLAENDPYASLVLARVHPGMANLGDITTADFCAAPRTDVLAAGFPCTDISDAGPRVGITGPRSGVWVHVARAVEQTRPSVVLLENVGAIRGRGLDTVLRDLGRRGYGVRWTTARASDVGAPHERRRWFAVALRGASGRPLEGWDRIAKPLPAHGVFTGGDVHAAPFAPRLAVGVFRRTPTANLGANGAAQDPRKRRAGGHGPTLDDEVCHLLPSPTSADGSGGPGRSVKRTGGDNLRTAVALLPELSWVCTDGRDFGPAVRHWERLLGRPAPVPVTAGPRGGRQLSPEFAEWMMGWPPGHVTATHTHTHTQPLPRREQLKLIGNGVVVQQAIHAYTWLADLWRKDL